MATPLVLAVALPLSVLLFVGFCSITIIIAECSESEEDRWPAAEDDEVEGGGEKGLTAEELERLEEGKMVVGGGEQCAVCQDAMEEKQSAVRVLPGCRHAFHRSCVDAWLQRHPNCPLCRARLLPPASLSLFEPQPPSPSSRI